MRSQARLAGIGAFVLAGLVLFAAGLFLIGERRSLFEDRFEVYAEFARVSGLETGARVRVAGMEAGEVSGIRVPSSASGKFRVTMQIREDLHVLVRTDSVATIQNDGIVGNKFVQVEAGTDAAPRAAARTAIGSREPFDFADVLEQASDTIGLVNTTIREVRGDVEQAISAVASVASHADALVDDLSDEVRSITTSAERIGRNLSSILAGIERGEGTVGKLVKDDDLYVRARDVAAEAQRVATLVRETAEDARRTMAGLRSSMSANEGRFGGLMMDLSSTMENAREAMSDLAENTEALKRNFLFRGFFNRRGYFDLGDLSPGDYRRLTGDPRKALRVWLGAAVLFAPASATLTDDGRERIDRAMATFVERDPGTPLIVEGYATGGARDERFRAAQERAEVVAGYLRRRFGLAAARLRVVPLGAEATGSPAGDTWDGVALTVLRQEAR